MNRHTGMFLSELATDQIEHGLMVRSTLEGIRGMVVTAASNDDEVMVLWDGGSRPTVESVDDLLIVGRRVS
jgi:hypothetical protein